MNYFKFKWEITAEEQFKEKISGQCGRGPCCN